MYRDFHTQLLLVNSAVIVGVLLLFGYQIIKTDKIVYIDNTKVFESFFMTIELKKVGESQYLVHKQKLDSVHASLNNLSGKEKEDMLRRYINEKEDIDAYHRAFSEEQSIKIWKRIRSYASEFATKEGYKIVLGSQANSNVVYGTEENDVTTDFLEFINKSYEGERN